MTDILFKKLKEEFPPIHDFSRVTIYGAQERIYLNLIDEAFSDADPFNNASRVEQLARELFDVNFVFESRGDVGTAIFFEPNVNDPYHLKHTHHYIQVHFRSRYPMMTIAIGNRGEGDLHDKQRENYFTFVKRIFELFVSNAKKNS